MVDFNIFNPAKSIDKYTTVTVSDGTHSFRLLLAYVGNIERNHQTRRSFYFGRIILLKLLEMISMIGSPYGIGLNPKRLSMWIP